MTVEIGNNIRREIQGKLPNEDEVMEYFQAQRMSGQAKKAYESYINEKYEDDTTDNLSDMNDNLGGSDVAATELRSMYGNMKSKIAQRIPKMLKKFEQELNNRVEEQNINVRSMSDLKDFCSKTQHNTKAVKNSLLSVVEQINGSNKVISAIKTVLKGLSYGVLKTVQTISAVFMLSILAWPVLVVGWPVKGTAIIVSAIMGLFGPAAIAERVDSQLFNRLI